MIPTQTMEDFPVWCPGQGKTAPGQERIVLGWQDADVVPHEWLNWLFFKSSTCSALHNRGVSSMERELNNLVEAAGLTPSESSSTQVKDAIDYLITLGGNAVEAITATTEKSPIKDSRYAITVANVSLTLTNDSGANHNLATATILFLAAGTIIYHDTTGTQVTESHAAGEIVSLRRAGQYWIPSVRNDNGNLIINL